MKNITIIFNKETKVKNDKSFDDHVIKISVQEKYKDDFLFIYEKFSKLNNVVIHKDHNEIENNVDIVFDDTFAGGYLNFHFGVIDNQDSNYFIINGNVSNLACYLALYCKAVYSQQDFSVSPSFIAVDDISGLIVEPENPTTNNPCIIKDNDQYCLYGDKNIKKNQLHKLILDRVIEKKLAVIISPFRAIKQTDYTKHNLITKVDDFFTTMKKSGQIKDYKIKEIYLDPNQTFKIKYAIEYHNIIESLIFTVNRTA